MNAYQLLMRPLIRARAISEGLHSLLRYGGPVFMDSGGFAFYRDGMCKVDPGELLELYAQLRPQIAAVLDVPLHPRASSRSNRRRWQLTLSNTASMQQFNGAVELAPVIHAYDIDAVAERHAELHAIMPDPRVICIGSLVPLLKASYVGSRFVNKGCNLPLTIQRWQFVARLVLTVRHLYPRSVVHVFGVGSLSTMYLLFSLGVDSVDSVSWRVKAGYGAIVLPGLSDRFFHYPRSSVRPRRVLEAEHHDLLARCQCPACDDLDIDQRTRQLAESFNARAVHNAHTLISEVDALRGEARRGRLLLFLERRLQSMGFHRSILHEAILPEIEKWPQRC